MEIKKYEHKAQYYETDQMGIVHHSNYIRWFESARLDLMEQLGIPYGRMEEMGIISPVMSVECRYREMVHFNDVVYIEAEIVKYNGIKMELKYKITNPENGNVCTTGSSSHCFLNREGKILFLKKEYPEIHKLFSDALNKS